MWNISPSRDLCEANHFAVRPIFTNDGILTNNEIS